MVVAHHSSGMTGMKDPTQRLGEVIGWVDDSWNVVHDDVTIIFPLLNSKPRDVNMFSGDLRVDHMNGGDIVAVHGSWALLRKSWQEDIGRVWRQ